MALATIFSRAQNALDAPLVSVEVNISGGLPGLTIVGLPETAVRESRDRVRAAIRNSGFTYPPSRITVNLAPADLPKEGSRFDLAIALGILAASGQVSTDALDRYEFLGELSLGGAIRPVTGVLPAALQTCEAGRQLILPTGNSCEAALISQLKGHVADSLLTVTGFLNGSDDLAQPQRGDINDAGPVADLSEVRGQQQAKRALEIAAAGGHSLLMLGPPGAGKSMLAQRLPGILPPMTDDEALEVASIASISLQGFDPQSWGQRPFRMPHHTSSGVALVGGGGNPRPGEITLAHNGVLFLDELPEFDRKVLEVLREPLESGHITISRAARQVDYPAGFQLLAAMNPCPCGYLGDSLKPCRCTPDQVSRYRMKISGPLLDRIDMHVSVQRLENHEITANRQQMVENSAEVRQRVVAARKRQHSRAGLPNARLSVKAMQTSCEIDPATELLLAQAIQCLTLSARGCDRILKLARTIADLAGADAIGQQHVSEAIGYRQLDRAVC